MAPKDKHIEAAQKHLQAGRVPKAIKEYEQVVKLDSKDFRSRQKLADLCSKQGIKDVALENYDLVAKDFANRGFYPKAIAVYKQMQKLDSSQVVVYQRLAELNEKQGLIGNAIAEYRTLVAHYEKNQMPSEAVGILQRMKDLEPENLNIRVKIAELYASLGSQDKGREEFADVLALLRDKQQFGKILKLYEVFLPLFPGEVTIGAGFAEACLKTGQADKALKVLKSILKENPDDAAVLSQLSDTYHQLKDYSNERLTLGHLLKLSPNDLDLRMRFICAAFSLGDKGRVLKELEEWKEAFFEAKRLSELKQLYERLLKSQPHEQRILRTLRSIYELTGDGDKLFKVMSELPADESETNFDIVTPTVNDVVDDSIMGGVDDELEMLDPEMLESIEMVEPEPIEIVDAFEETIELIEDDLLDEIEEIEEVDELEEVEELEEIEELEEVEELEEFVELDEVEEIEEVEEALLVTDTGFDLEIELEIDEPEEEAVLEISEDDIQEIGDGRDVFTALEEIEFYLQQGLLDDAERSCSELLELVPENEKVRNKLDEIARKRSSATASPVDDFIDLAAEVMAATEEVPEDESSSFDLNTDFATAAAEVETVVSLEDAESHYNLGIAYKEMGLIDDAIAEFDKAMRNPARLVDSLVLKAICLAESSNLDEAEQVFWAVLEQPDLEVTVKVALQFELGLFYENADKRTEALSVYEEVALFDASYRDVSERMVALQGKKASPAGGASGGRKDRVSYI